MVTWGEPENEPLRALRAGLDAALERFADSLRAALRDIYTPDT